MKIIKNKNYPSVTKAAMAHRGFTLVELLVVIAIMSILTVFAISGYLSSQVRARDTSRKGNLKALSNALNLYFADNGVFPAENVLNTLISEEDEFYFNGVLYMKKVPKEQKVSAGVTQFEYQVSNTNKSFRLYANLENGEDEDCLKDSNGVNLLTSNGYKIDKANSCIYLITSSNASVDDLP